MRRRANKRSASLSSLDLGSKYAAGALHSTPLDLSRFAAAILPGGGARIALDEQLLLTLRRHAGPGVGGIGSPRRRVCEQGRRDLRPGRIDGIRPRHTRSDHGFFQHVSGSAQLHAFRRWRRGRGYRAPPPAAANPHWDDAAVPGSNFESATPGSAICWRYWIARKSRRFTSIWYGWDAAPLSDAFLNAWTRLQRKPNLKIFVNFWRDCWVLRRQLRISEIGFWICYIIFI